MFFPNTLTTVLLAAATLLTSGSDTLSVTKLVVELHEIGDASLPCVASSVEPLKTWM